MKNKRLLFAASTYALCSMMGTASADNGEDQPTTVTLPKAPSYENGSFTLQTFGRVMYDYTSADADRASNYDVDDGEWRRVRLGVKGDLNSKVSYKIELDTNSSGEVGVEDAYIQFAPTGGPLKVQIGQFNTPNSLDELTSSRFSATLERAAFTDAVAFKRRAGIALSTKSDSYTLTAGLFGSNLNDGSIDDEFAIAARGTYVLLDAKDTLVHVGASGRYLEVNDDQPLLRYRQRPFTHLSGRIVSTGRIATTETFLGIEGAAIHKNFWAAAEYINLQADVAATGSNPNFNGGYLEAGAFIGGRRTYAGGKFDRPDVDHHVTQGGYGAISLVARYDVLDLSDSGVNGGELDTQILGAEWWLTDHAHIGLNYFKSDAGLGTSTSGLDSNFAALVTAAESNETADGFVMRLQFDF